MIEDGVPDTKDGEDETHPPLLITDPLQDNPWRHYVDFPDARSVCSQYVKHLATFQHVVCAALVDDSFHVLAGHSRREREFLCRSFFMAMNTSTIHALIEDTSHVA